MTTEEFITAAQTANDLNKYLAKRIVKQYIPFEEKMTRAQSIVNQTSHQKIGDKTIYQINSPARYLFTIMTFVDMYTDIDVNMGESLQQYNQLSECGLLTKLLTNIPAEEISLFNSLLEMIDSDTQENERSLINWLDNKFQAIGAFTDSISETINKPEFQDKLQEVLKAQQ